MSITRDRFLGGGRYLALTSTHKLTYGLARAWNLSAAASGKSVTLDDARRVGLGFGQYVLHNSGSNAIAVKDSAGTTLFSLAAGTVATLGLVTNSTAAGKWKWFVGDAGSSRTFSRPTRAAVANNSLLGTTEPNCAGGGDGGDPICSCSTEDRVIYTALIGIAGELGQPTSKTMACCSCPVDGEGSIALNFARNDHYSDGTPDDTWSLSTTSCVWDQSFSPSGAFKLTLSAHAFVYGDGTYTDTGYIWIDSSWRLFDPSGFLSGYFDWFDVHSGVNALGNPWGDGQEVHTGGSGTHTLDCSGWRATWGGLGPNPDGWTTFAGMSMTLSMTWSE